MVCFGPFAPMPSTVVIEAPSQEAMDRKQLLMTLWVGVVAVVPAPTLL